MATKTAIIVICQEAILIYAIPPLSPQPPDFSYHIDMPTHILPLFTIPLPDGIVHQSKPMGLKTFQSWYFGPKSDMFFPKYSKVITSEVYRFQIILKVDLSAASLHVNSSESRVWPGDFVSLHKQDYRICDDTIVSCWFYIDHDNPGQYNCGVYMGLNFTRFAVISHGGPALEKSFLSSLHHYRLFSCPASGRFVLLDVNNQSSRL